MKRKQALILITVAIIVAIFIFSKMKDKKNIALDAQKEVDHWLNLTEHNPESHSRLVEYWQDGAGWDWIKDSNISAFASKYAWSAAFISYVVKKTFSEFPSSATHANYTVWARDRRNAGETKMIAYNTNEYKPTVGDILIKKRGYNGNLEDLYKTAKTHGDIVIENNGNYLTVVGGNVSNTVKKTIVPLENGYITNNNWFAIIKM